MHERSDEQLLRDYAENGDEAAFQELVVRHTDVIYSAALRQVGSPDLAGDVAQGVFTDLARKARSLAQSRTENISILGWLYRGTRYAALNQLRDDRRRQARERQTMEDFDPAGETATDWEHVKPLLDQVMSELNEDDREALLLRFFRNRNFRVIGDALGVSDDAAQKRVNRALEKLRMEFARRGVTTTAVALTTVLAENAVIAAPAGLAATLGNAALAGAMITTTTTVTTAIIMTTIQKIIVGAALAVVAGAGIYEGYQNARLHGQLEALEAKQAPLLEQLQALQKERDAATNRLASLADQASQTRKTPAEVLKLRNEVSKLHNENIKIGSTSALSKVTADPDTKKFVRNQQKAAMGIFYATFAKNMKLTSDQTEKFNDLLANNVMDNIDLITEVLHDKTPTDKMNQIFADQNAALQEKIQEMLGPDGLTQYQDYTHNLLSSLSTTQFKDSLSGDDAAKEQKSKMLQETLQTEMQSALANAGLSPDYQAIPILNFSNIASPNAGDQSLQLMDTIYQNAVAKAASFLSPEELEKFRKFKDTAVNNNRTALSMNRTMMAPISQ